MTYTLQTNRDGFRGGKNILASEHQQNLEGGATLDAAAFGAGYIELGTAIVKDGASGKFVPYAGVLDGFTEPAILNIDANCNGVDDIIVGEVLIRASVYADKLPANVDAAFKTATAPYIRYVSEQ